MAQTVGIYQWDWDSEDAPPKLVGHVVLLDDGTLGADTPDLEGMVSCALNTFGGDAQAAMNDIRRFSNGYVWASDGGTPGMTLQGDEAERAMRPPVSHG